MYFESSSTEGVESSLDFSTVAWSIPRLKMHQVCLCALVMIFFIVSSQLIMSDFILLLYPRLVFVARYNEFSGSNHLIATAAAATAVDGRREEFLLYSFPSFLSRRRRRRKVVARSSAISWDTSREQRAHTLFAFTLSLTRLFLSPSFII
jgi:hypothetical protein